MIGHFTRVRCYALTALLLIGVATRGTAEEVEGFTEPYRDIDVAASEPGSITSITVREGERVEAGQVLALLDDNVLRASLDIVLAERESKGRLDSALAELRLQEDLLSKIQELREQKHASLQELERAFFQREIAAARVASVHEELAVKALECERTRAQLERRRIHSPISGIVTRIFKDQGEFVTAGEPEVLKIVQLDPLLVVFSVPMGKAREIAVEEFVDLRIGESRDEVQGIIEFVSPTADPQSSTVRVRVRIANPDERYPSGSTCRLILPSDTTKLAGTRN